MSPTLEYRNSILLVSLTASTAVVLTIVVWVMIAQSEKKDGSTIVTNPDSVPAVIDESAVLLAKWLEASIGVSGVISIPKSEAGESWIIIVPRGASKESIERSIGVSSSTAEYVYDLMYYTDHIMLLHISNDSVRSFQRLPGSLATATAMLVFRDGDSIKVVYDEALSPYTFLYKNES